VLVNGGPRLERCVGEGGGEKGVWGSGTIDRIVRVGAPRCDKKESVRL